MTYDDEAIGSALAAFTLAQLTLTLLLKEHPEHKPEAERALQMAIDTNKKGSPANQKSRSKAGDAPRTDARRLAISPSVSAPT